MPWSRRSIDKLGNIGKTVVYYADPEPERPAHIAALRTLVEKIHAGKVKTLLILGGNPVYDAPADLKFAEALAKVPAAIHLALHEDETSQLCTWHLSRAHYLEAWGDVRTYDGTVSIVQPLIEPLFDGRSAIEVLAMLAGDGRASTAAATRSSAARSESLVGESFSEWKWKKALADGVVEGHRMEGRRESRGIEPTAAGCRPTLGVTRLDETTTWSSSPTARSTTAASPTTAGCRSCPSR